jgi:hypothetical protein
MEMNAVYQKESVAVTEASSPLKCLQNYVRRKRTLRVYSREVGKELFTKSSP